MHPDETVDWESVAKQFQQENEMYRNQWKGFQYHQQNHWTIHVRKPAIMDALKRDAARLRTMDPQRLYFYTLIVCTILATAIECYVALSKGVET